MTERYFTQCLTLGIIHAETTLNGSIFMNRGDTIPVNPEFSGFHNPDDRKVIAAAEAIIRQAAQSTVDASPLDSTLPFVAVGDSTHLLDTSQTQENIPIAADTKTGRPGMGSDVKTDR